MDERGPDDVLRHLSVLRIEPGDTLVYRHPGRIPAKSVEWLRETFARHFGADTKLLVLEDGAELGVIRFADAPPEG